MTSGRPKLSIAVTGATGFVGRHVIEALAGSDVTLRLLVRIIAPESVPAHAIPIRGSLEDEAALAQLVSGADAVLHLAGANSARSAGTFLAINEEGTRRLAVAASRAGVSRFVHISSLAAREPDLSAYAASKRAAEERLSQIGGSMKVAMIRAPAVYGPGDKATLPLIQQLTQRFALIPSSPTARFSLLYVKDLARIATSALDSNWCGLRDADDGKAGGYSWGDLAATSAAIEDHPVTPVFLPRTLALSAAGLISAGAGIAGRASMTSPAKVRELYHPDWVSRLDTLQADPPTSLLEGLRRTLAWYRQEGWLPESRSVDRRRLRERGVKSL